jgi:uncharacterized membrane protein YdjX (TVP38/TMEM64 family)
MNPPVDPSDQGRSSLWRPALVLLLLVAALVVVYLSPLSEHLKRVQDLGGKLREMGFAGGVVFALGVFVLTAIGVPRLLLCAIGGLAFGFWRGVLLIHFATWAGSYMTFLFIRWGGRDYVLRRWPQVRRMHAMLGPHPTWSVVLLRQIPMPGGLINAFLALSPLSHRNFLLGSFLGFIPQEVPVVLLGSSAIHGNPAHQLATLGGTVLLFAGYLLFRRFARQRSDLIRCPKGEDSPSIKL